MKSSKPVSTEPAISNPDSDIRILKVGTCPTLSEKSTLTYHIGCNAESEIQFRIFENSNPGYFSQEWISMKAIQRASSKIPIERPLTSFLLLASLFTGRSINTPAFLMAVLKSEGLVRHMDGKDRYFERMDTVSFMKEMKSLIKSGGEHKDADKPKKSGAVKQEVPLKKASSKARNRKVPSASPT